MIRQIHRREQRVKRGASFESRMSALGASGGDASARGATVPDIGRLLRLASGWIGVH
jgi:hypothetical protein